MVSWFLIDNRLIPALRHCCPGSKRSPHFGHSIRNVSIRRRSPGGIACPHFVQIVLSDAMIMARLIFCFDGIPCA
jgi:hypothetical protein